MQKGFIKNSKEVCSSSSPEGFGNIMLCSYHHPGIARPQMLYFWPGEAKLMILRSVNSSTPAIPPNLP